ncbi:hypothetical protein Y032_0003g1224 [Ancylostoma ceylanicum]|uniref:Helicase ATP-binding domain-containing protein n=1 Tax=Ancylostoma ceylanicum TaxID=53326 RepID=A0A016VWH0_9BILA|nr:hypothetical protein Y032_0003g1224 [Ancylostoma ceylanicum]
MGRTPKSKTASLYQFWTAQQQRQNQEQEELRQHHREQTSANAFRFQDEIITLSDSPLEHLNIVPFNNSATPNPPKKNIPSWAPLVRHSTTSDPSPSSKYLPAPVRHISPASEAELERAGFDPLEGSSIRYPANEYLRQYEMDIVKSCVAVNSTISLPLAVSADHICAVIIVNFLRWFPRSRAIFCCNSLDAAEMFKERGIVVGIVADEISIVDTLNTFKKMPTHQIGRVIITTPQTLEKIVESESTIIEDIRCMVLNLDASDTRITKYKSVVGTLTVKGILFRVILVSPSVPSSSRKLGPLRKRQQMITSLFISQWIEPPASDYSFRSASIPLGISTEYCSSIEVLSETQSFIEKWLEVGISYLEKLREFVPLPSTKPEHLFNLDWGQIAALVVNCMFLVESARNLIVNGPRIFYLYCVDLFGNVEQNPRACNVQQMILADATLSKIYEKIQAKYGYRAGSIFDITYNNLSLNSHPKFSRLNKVFDKFASPLRCLVLCENEFVSRVVCESLSNTSRFRNAIIRVLPHSGAPAEFSKYHRLPTQCTGLFSRPSDDVIMVLGMDIADAANVIDTACSNELHLVVSMDRRYNFNFEFSRLQLPSSKMQLVQYLPHTNTRNHKDGAIECPWRHGFELTSAEFSEFCERLATLPAIEHGAFSRSRGLALLGQSYDVINAQPYSENWGDVPNSILSSRVNEYSKGMDVIKKRKKTLFSYTDELVDKKKIEFYDSVIEELDKLLGSRSYWFDFIGEQSDEKRSVQNSTDVEATVVFG